ncbi:DegT/DnrJ/EryC1/StrS family aminotransferase [Peribacillus sp. NPDC097895]|uniref:DegT/DnrJ/EryC1/StrS family aminotransferase n=1 Tax=Peribacillus sp. NPDC097895 TaxID=3390619 RepID=UPI003D094769
MENIVNTKPVITDWVKREYLTNLPRILDSGKLILGDYTRKFEEGVRQYSKSKYAVALSSATAAIEVILKYLDVEGKEVIMPSNTFVSPVYAVKNAKGRVVLCDINLDDFNLDLNSLKNAVTPNTKVVLITYIAGKIPSNIFEMKEFCDENNLYLIEDASHAFGAAINGYKAGSIGNAGVFSMYPTKIVTSATGGVITTDDERLSKYCELLRHHGNESGAINQVLSSDMLLSEFNALLGYLQIQEADWMIHSRQEIFQYYKENLEGVFRENGLYFQAEPDHNDSTYYKIIVMSKNKEQSEKFQKHLKERHISTGHCYGIPLHLQPTLRDEYAQVSLPNAERFSESHFTLPCHLELSEEDLTYIVTTCKQVLLNDDEK